MEVFAGFVLGAGSGTRLRPLTDLRPKALCPVNNVALVDLAIERLESMTSDITVNAWHHREQMTAHVSDRVQLSVEAPEPLGTAGALANVREWIAGRPVLVHNADAWHQADIRLLTEGWDGERVRLLVVDDPSRADFENWRFCGVSLMPWSEIEQLRPEPSGLWERSWKRLHASGLLDLVPYDGPFYDCGTPADYLAANLTASGGKSVIGDGAIVEGEVVRSVLWPGSRVERGERLCEVIRADGGVTVDASMGAGVRR